MKKIILSLTFIFLSHCLLAQKEIPVKSTIDEVIVYYKGTQVIRHAKASIPVGKSILLFKTLLPGLQDDKIQLSCNDSLRVLSMTYQKDTTLYVTEKQMIKDLEAQKKKQLLQIEVENNKLPVIDYELKLFEQNNKISQTNFKTQDLRELCDFSRQRMNELTNLKFDINQNITKLKLDVVEVERKQASLQLQIAKEIFELSVLIDANQTINAEFELQYFLESAGWKPSYNLHVSDIDKPVDLTFKATVSQYSGENWKDVVVSLSTSTPTFSTSPKMLNTWYLAPIVSNSNQELDEVVVIGYGSQKKVNRSPAQGVASYGRSQGTSNFTGSTTTTEVQPISLLFKVLDKHTIESSYTGKVLQVREFSLPATYSYFCTPKTDPAAYLKARVTGWGAYSLVSGEMNVYFQNTLSGKSTLDMYKASDTLDFFLGRDKAISVKREKTKYFTEEFLLSNDVKTSYEWTISLRNNKKADVLIYLEDQFPLSTNSDIKVEKNITANFDDRTGKIKWTVNLKPSESKEFRFDYSVRYPEGLNLNLEY